MNEMQARNGRTEVRQESTVAAPDRQDDRVDAAPAARDIEVIQPAAPTLVHDPLVDESVEATAVDGASNQAGPSGSPKAGGLRRLRPAGLMAAAFVLLAVAAGVLTKYPDLRGNNTVASAVLGFDSTELPLVVRGQEIRGTRVRIADSAVTTYWSSLPVNRTPWTIETDASSPFTEIRFDTVDDNNTLGVRQIVSYGGWEVFRRVEGVDSRLGWINAPAKDPRPLIIVRTATRVTVFLGVEQVAVADLDVPKSTRMTVGMLSTEATPRFTYFDFRETK